MALGFKADPVSKQEREKKKNAKITPARSEESLNLQSKLPKHKGLRNRSVVRKHGIFPTTPGFVALD